MTPNRKKKEMARTYALTLGEGVKERTSTARDRNAVAFLAVRDEVKEAMGAGFPLKTIWTHMYAGGSVPFGYDTFLNYVNRYILRPEGDAAPEPSWAADVQETPAPMKDTLAGQSSGPKMKRWPEMKVGHSSGRSIDTTESLAAMHSRHSPWR